MDIESYLTQHGIAFTRYEHPAVFTCEESERLCPPMPGAQTKNLFLRDRDGKRHFLVVVGHNKNVNLKELRHVIGVNKLSFASPVRLKTHLGVEPGSATLLGLIHDSDHQVEVIIDEPIWNAESVLCHPLVNTSTMNIAHAGIEAFFAATGHKPKILVVPQITTAK